MIVFKCKMCGGDLEVAENATVGTCRYCGSTMTLPRADGDKRRGLYERANRFRMAGEYDRARGMFESLLNDDPTDPEAYWGVVLCDFGVEYVEDPKTHRRIPTCNRTRKTSILSDPNYRQVLKYASGEPARLYETEAAAIDTIQRGILSVVAQEKPFDVFLCYKETDANGRRTPDSVLAQELYNELTEMKFRVFFARITLEDKLGTEYEPYIFSALQSASVMVVLGTKPEYFNAVWVKNEWSRFLALIREGRKKTLIPAYRDMDPYALPEEFSHLQALDMGKLGFMQDLVHGIRKLVRKEFVAPSASALPPIPPALPRSGVVPPPLPPSVDTVSPMFRRAMHCIEDGDYLKADQLLEAVLNQEPENAQAYMGKVLVRLNVPNLVEASQQTKFVLEEIPEFQRALRYANETERISFTAAGAASRTYCIQYLLEQASDAMDAQDYKNAKRLYARVLSLDATNIAARNHLQSLNEPVSVHLKNVSSTLINPYIYWNGELLEIPKGTRQFQITPTCGKHVFSCNHPDKGIVVWLSPGESRDLEFGIPTFATSTTSPFFLRDAKTRLDVGEVCLFSNCPNLEELKKKQLEKDLLQGAAGCAIGCLAMFFFYFLILMIL
ncbi:MAG: TIR domain-containing protein [Planctomycetia bacterium]|nr:TIR domain-containing protein [Planctomycetia bacterium]